MNPFSRFLLQWSEAKRADLASFVAQWDVLEQLVIRVYKAKTATAVDEQTYQTTRAWLQAHYPSLAAPLEPHWRTTAVAGQLDHADPFTYLFQPERAADFVGNWAAMQHLPAAREALNKLLVAEASDR